MSHQRTQEALGTLNRELQVRYDDGRAICLDVEARPMLSIVSFVPLAYEAYGGFRNRPPHIRGSLVLRAFLSLPDSEGSTAVIAGLEGERQGFGFCLDSYDPSAMQAINGVAIELGHPELQFTSESSNS